MGEGPSARKTVKLRSFSRSLPMSLLLAREAVMQKFRQPLRRFGTTEQQWRVLRALSAVEAIEITELAKATGLLSPSLSRILKDLEERGQIVRIPVKQDLRRAEISITPQGLLLIDSMAPYSEGIYGQITEAFGQERLDLLQKLLRELVEVAENLPPPPLPDEDASRIGKD
ncbi:homoprotocatechuate degradation operon regulator HpaR [Plastorhodobacter daqingensis]|uniref:Homoprotocatechuate degradation operon regulator HpaR n=1 Tax=Plastorhodobacter daqingensis TaxID=1387281 RepID=A0ABW2UI39_9RHOB